MTSNSWVIELVCASARRSNFVSSRRGVDGGLVRDYIRSITDIVYFRVIYREQRGGKVGRGHF